MSRNEKGEKFVPGDGGVESWRASVFRIVHGPGDGGERNDALIL